MAIRQTTRTYIKYSVLFSIIFSLFMISFAYMKSDAAVSYGVEKKETIFIENTEQLEAAREGLYNDECLLTGDIEITDTNFVLGTIDKKFVGTFDGNGYTVNLNFGSLESYASFFGYIGEGAVVKNVNFVVEGVDVKTNALGLIATVNEGMIQNCTMTFKDVRLDRSGAYSPFVKINKGTISNVYITGKLTNSAIANADEQKTYISSVCVYNYGKVENSIISVEYNGFSTTDKEGILNREYSNKTICAVSCINIGEASVKNCKVIIDESTYLADQTIDFVPPVKTSLIFEDVSIFQVLDFDNRYWSLKDGKLSLIVAMN